MNEFHFFFETFLKLNNFKVFEIEMNESTSVFSSLGCQRFFLSRATKWASGGKTSSPVRSFAMIFSHPKRAKNLWNPGKPGVLTIEPNNPDGMIVAR